MELHRNLKPWPPGVSATRNGRLCRFEGHRRSRHLGGSASGLRFEHIRSPHRPAVARLGTDSTASEAAIPAEAWPICSSMGSLAESPDSAMLDPDFAAGKRAIMAGDWQGAIEVLTYCRAAR